MSFTWTQGVFFRRHTRATNDRVKGSLRFTQYCCLPCQVEPGKKITSETASKLILGNDSLLNEAFNSGDLNKAVQIATTVIQEILKDSSINGSLRTEVGKYFVCLLSIYFIGIFLIEIMPMRTNTNYLCSTRLLPMNNKLWPSTVVLNWSFEIL